jgi:hypothetical protein
MAHDHFASLGRQLPLQEIVGHHDACCDALRHYYVIGNVAAFPHYTPLELAEELSRRIAEMEKLSALSILAAVEAHIRLDFIKKGKEKGPKSARGLVSRGLRDLYQQETKRGRKPERVELDRILEVYAWDDSRRGLISELRATLNYRHWLAHGRYWPPKFGKYDYDSVYTLAMAINRDFILGL